MSKHTNLASEVNAKIINQRFKELETENSEVREALKRMELTIATLNNKLDSQTEMYQKFFVQQYGTGSTERIDK